MKNTTPLMLSCVGADVLLAVWDLERPMELRAQCPRNTQRFASALRIMNGIRRKKQEKVERLS